MTSLDSPQKEEGRAPSVREAVEGRSSLAFGVFYGEGSFRSTLVRG